MFASFTSMIAQRQALTEQDFAAIESALGSELANYQVYLYYPEGFWQSADYVKVKQEVVDSYTVDPYEQQHPSLIGRRIAYLIDKAEQTLFMNVTYWSEDPEAIDWHKTKHFDEWSTTVTPVDEAIAVYREKQKLERAGRPAPKWWQFWLVD